MKRIGRFNKNGLFITRISIPIERNIHRHPIEQVMKTANEKRRETCKKIGSEKKKTGHAREEIFGDMFCDKTPITTKAEADKTITDPFLLANLRMKLGVLSGQTSIKSGNNIQFILGNIPEVTDADNKLEAIATPIVWNKYLRKSMSRKPADVLAYREDKRWIFFNMEDVIRFILSSAQWRMLSTGRIKGDFSDSSKKGKRQYLSYEYRKGKGYFLGENGNKGKPFIQLLMTKISFHIEEDK